MLTFPSWMRTSLRTGRRWLRSAESRTVLDEVVSASMLAVPIRALHAGDRPRILRHLLALDAQDRYLRFGYAASDEQIARYVERLDFARDKVFGIYNRGLSLIAVAHLAFGKDAAAGAEFGVSVGKKARGRGYGARLFARAVLIARNAGVGTLFIHALTENRAMLRIARKAGAEVKRDGGESAAYLQLPPPDWDSRLGQWVEHGFAEVDYSLKRQARQFWRVLRDVHEVRQGVRDGRGRAAP